MKNEKKDVKTVGTEEKAVELAIEDLDKVSGGSIRNAKKEGTQPISPGTKDKL